MIQKRYRYGSQKPINADRWRKSRHLIDEQKRMGARCWEKMFPPFRYPCIDQVEMENKTRKLMNRIIEFDGFGSACPATVAPATVAEANDGAGGAGCCRLTRLLPPEPPPPRAASTPAAITRAAFTRAASTGTLRIRICVTHRRWV